MNNPFATENLIASDFTALADAVDQNPLTDDTLDDVAAQINALDSQIKSLEVRRDLLKKALTDRFIADDLKKIETKRFKVTRAAAARRVVLHDGILPESLPTEYQTVSVDAKAVRDAANDGVDLSAFLTLAEPTYYLRITARK